MKKRRRSRRRRKRRKRRRGIGSEKRGGRGAEEKT